MVSNLTFGKTVEICQTFDYSKLELDKNQLKVAHSVDYPKTTRRFGGIVTDHTSLRKALDITPVNLMSLMLDTTKELGSIKAFLMPPVDQYLLIVRENQVQSVKVTESKDSRRAHFVDCILDGVITILRVIPKKKSFPDLILVKNQLLCSTTAPESCAGDYEIETLVNWTEKKRHGAFDEANEYMNSIVCDTKQCSYRYTLENAPGLRPWQDGDLEQEHILEHLYLSNVGLGRLNNFLKQHGHPEVKTTDFDTYYTLTGYESKIRDLVRKMKDDDAFKLHTISKFFKDLTAFSEYFGKFRNTVVQYLKSRFLNIHRCKIAEVIEFSTGFKDLLRKMDKLTEYPLRRIQDKWFYVVEKPSDAINLEDCRKIVRLKNEESIALISRIYEKLDSMGYMLIICGDNDECQQSESIMINPYVRVSEEYDFCGFITCKTTNWSSSPKEVTGPRYIETCTCSKKYRYWKCSSCAEFVKVNNDFLYCRCGRMTKKDCEFQCFSLQHGEHKKSFFGKVVDMIRGVEAPIPKNEAIVEVKQKLKSYSEVASGKVTHCRSTSNTINGQNNDKPVSAESVSISNQAPQMISQQPEQSKKHDHPPTSKQPGFSTATMKTSEMPALLFTQGDNKERIASSQLKENKKPMPPPTGQKPGGANGYKNGKKPQPVKTTIHIPAIDWKSTQGPPLPCNSDIGHVREKHLNVLLIGKMGVGKSTLINSFNNYVKHSNPEAAQQQSLHCIIPVKFNVFNEDYSETSVEVGESDENEVFRDALDAIESTTQKSKIYSFHDTERTVNFIDTPGITPTNKNQVMAEIKSKIMSFNKIHGICFVLKPNESKLDQQMENVMRELILFCPKSMLDKIFFFMTHSMSTFFGPGDSMQPLKVFTKNLKESNKIDVPLKKDNIFCFDNEAFRFLCAHSKNIDYNMLTEHDYPENWNNSRTAMYRFFNTIYKKNTTFTRDIQLKQLLQPVAGQFHEYQNTAMFKSLPDVPKSDLYQGFYFTLKKLAELETDDYASQLLQRLSPNMMKALSSGKINENFVISDQTLLTAADLFKQYHMKATPELENYCKWLQKLENDEIVI